MTPGPSSKIKVLFVCIGNMVRSQMAEGFARARGGAFVEVHSAGLSPTGIVSPEAIAVMAEKHIDIGQHHSKGLHEVPLHNMDCVVTMSGQPAEEICPPGFEGLAVTWDVKDPLGRPIATFRAARDSIEERVNGLLADLWRSDPRKGRT